MEETPEQAIARAERTQILEALAHLRFRTHRYIATCPQCFNIEKILHDNRLVPPDRTDKLTP